MSGENNGPADQGGAGNGGDSSDASKGGGTDNGGGSEFKAVTFSTQAEFDAAFADRATRAAESAKAEALKALTDAGISLDDALEAYNEKQAAEEAKKGPEAKERERAEKDRAELKAYKDREARDKIVKDVAKDLKVKIKVGNQEQEHAIPAELITGNTKEQMEASGKALIAFVETVIGQASNGPRPPAYNPSQGHNQQDQLKSPDPIRSFFETGSFQ